MDPSQQKRTKSCKEGEQKIQNKKKYEFLRASLFGDIIHL